MSSKLRARVSFQRMTRWLSYTTSVGAAHLLLRGQNLYLGSQSPAQFTIPSLGDSEASWSETS
jgi:hypothetical protein